MQAPVEKGLARWSFPIAIVLMVVWGVNFSVTKTILDQLPVAALLFVRFLWMMLLGLGLIGWLYRGRLRQSLPHRRGVPRFIAAGLIGRPGWPGPSLAGCAAMCGT